MKQSSNSIVITVNLDVSNLDDLKTLQKIRASLDEAFSTQDYEYISGTYGRCVMLTYTKKVVEAA